jgi:hypothetical protein
MPTEREVMKSNDSNSSDISSISTTAVAVASLDSAENEFESSGNSMKVLLSLAVGLPDGNNGFFDGEHSEDSRFPQKNKKKWKPTNVELLKEIKRRKKMYNLYSITQRTNMQQSKRSACQWLMTNPLTNQIEIDWIQKKVGDFLMVVANAEKEKNEKQRDQWSGLVPYLRLIHCLTDFDSVRAALQQSFTVMTRDQLDGSHNENNIRKCPWTLASDKWNESNYNPKLSIYTNLHDDFKDSIDLAFSKVENMGICTPDKFKSKFSKMKNELVLIRTNYNKSGNGDGSAIEIRNSSTGKTPEDELDKEESNIAMMDCNKKGSFLNGRSSAVLYLWEKAEEYDLLSTVCQQLSPDTSFDSTEIDNVEDISLKGRKRKNWKIKIMMMLIMTCLF